MSRWVAGGPVDPNDPALKAAYGDPRGIKLTNYGAGPFDGSTDNTDSYTAALADLVAKGVRVLRVPPLSRFSTTITVDSTLAGLTIVGNGHWRNAQRAGSEIHFSGSGAAFQIGTDDGSAYDAADYSGPEGFTLMDVHLKATGTQTALDSGQAGDAGYVAGTYGIRDWRGGDVRLIRASMECFDHWFWGVASDLNRFDDIRIFYSHSGGYFGPRSDQARIGEAYFAKCDRVLEVDGARNLVFDAAIDSCGTATQAPVYVHSSSWSTPAESIDLSDCWMENTTGVAVLPAYFEIGGTDATRTGDVTISNTYCTSGRSTDAHHVAHFARLGNVSAVTINGIEGAQGLPNFAGNPPGPGQTLEFIGSSSPSVAANLSSAWRTYFGYVNNGTGTPTVSTVLNDASLSALVKDRQSLTGAAIQAAYAPLTAGVMPLRVAWIGDSRNNLNMKSPGGVVVTKGNNWLTTGSPDTVASYQPGMNSPLTWACKLSGGRMIEIYNGAVAGATTADMVATYLPAVLAKSGFNFVFLGDMRNDPASSISEATTRANIVALIGSIKAAGKIPILYTCLPDTSSANAYTAAIRRHNTWLRQYAAANQLYLVDPYAAMVDPASTAGGYVSGYSSDGTHPTTAAAQLAGQKIVDDLAGLLRGSVSPSRASFVAQDRASTPNLLLNPLMQDDANSDGLADNWSGTYPGSTLSLVTDANIIGKAQQIVVASGTVVYQQGVTVDGSNVSVGDRVAWGGLMKTSGAVAGAMNYQAVFSQIGATYTVQPFGQVAGIELANWTPFYAEMVVQPGVSQIRARFQVDAGTGTLLIAQQRIVNLTKLGGP